jgi:hypothetical protein
MGILGGTGFRTSRELLINAARGESFWSGVRDLTGIFL